MAYELPDWAEREEALDPRYSYIVQAPAGSGKTELLTQRFLKLLAMVETPESIVALTFTKKAAREMRDRILGAIEKVRINPEAAAISQTGKLAQAVLQQDEAKGWQLLSLPNRLRIQTIDSLCLYLVSQMPLLSRGIPYAAVAEAADEYYFEAACRCLKYGMNDSDYQEAFETLLSHLGNHHERCLELLTQMLKRREQWLPYLMPRQDEHPDDLRQQLEQSLKNLLEDSQAQVDHCFEGELQQELKVLMDFAKSHLPEATTSDEKWIVNFLLTGEKEWRIAVNKTQGFPAVSESKNAEEKALYKSMKERMKALLELLRDREDCRLALENYHYCPKDAYSEEQWKILLALMKILPLLAAELGLVFSESGTVDFNEIAHQALEALGNLNEPSDLALYCDHTIHHLLIDEFQDTSLKQFCLIEKLMAGWEDNDGRTLFIVGDPMQSIYRFREADVGLFLRAKMNGIGGIKLQSLALKSNFRSHPNLIEWVNGCFQNIFPLQDNLDLNAVRHHPSKPGLLKHWDTEGNVTFHHCETEEQQAQQIIERIQGMPPDKKTAILVRSRNQLQTLLLLLRTAGIAFQGVDLDPLSTRPCIQDLCSLTQALLQPDNRLAWMSVLRAPWCGLRLKDLWILAQIPAGSRSFLTALGDYCQLENLSEEAKKRLNTVYPILLDAVQQRQRKTLAVWVENVWRNLHGHYCIKIEEHSDIERFWALLEQWEETDLPSNLLEKVSQLFSNTPVESNLHIMTIHKSKGLEFDSVILPHLESSLLRHEKVLLRWAERRNTAGTNDLILAPLKAVEENKDEYHYLDYLDKQKAVFEYQRLLYVALTRAKTSLHLFSVQAPQAVSFLKWLEPHLSDRKILINVPEENSKPDIKGKLIRLPDHYFLSNLPDAADKIMSVPELSLPDSSQLPAIAKNFPEHDDWMRVVGIFIHEQIKYCCDHCVVNPEKMVTTHWKNRLVELGLLSRFSEAIEITRQALNNLYNDFRGQWIIKQHQEAQSEYPLSFFEKGKLKNIIIDRTFIDEETNHRWIIDYKVTKGLQPSIEKYKKQLDHYADIFFNKKTQLIFLGLYYPLTKTWFSWKHESN